MPIRSSGARRRGTTSTSTDAGTPARTSAYADSSANAYADPDTHGPAEFVDGPATAQNFREPPRVCQIVLPTIAACVNNLTGPPQAICNDRAFSCSTGSGTGSGHGGVYCWRN